MSEQPASYLPIIQDDSDARAWIRRRLGGDQSPVGTFNRTDAERSASECYGPSGILPWVLRHAQARKLMGAFRYEQVEHDGLSYDDKARLGLSKTFLDRLRDKLSIYDETGNQECLIDCFNYLLLELARPIHPAAHFRSTERRD